MTEELLNEGKEKEELVSLKFGWKLRGNAQGSASGISDFQDWKREHLKRFGKNALGGK